MRASVASICIGLALSFSSGALAQGEKAAAPAERKSIDRFNHDANYYSTGLILKCLQFTAPYPGYYQLTSLGIDGRAFTGRIVPDWAVQASESAKLDAPILDQIRGMLAHLYLPSEANEIEPQPGKLHGVFVFDDGNAYRRLTFDSEIPPALDAILKIIQKELTEAATAQAKEFTAHQNLLRETYGDWRNRDGVTIPNNNRMHGCKDGVALLLGLLGQRKPSSTAQPAAVSVYHVLVFYPGGGVTGGGSGGTTWSDDPVSRQGVTWTMPNPEGSYDKKYQHELNIEHNAIDETIKIRGETYYLTRGNLFVIRMSEEWTPAVIQLNDRFDQVASEQIVLDRFKSIMTNDTSIQRLELFRQ
jgi:hypothetical protein